MSVKLTITEDIARAALLAAVDSQGAGHVNPILPASGCALTYEGKHCIVGEALDILGVPLPAASTRHNALNVVSFGEGRQIAFFERKGVEFTPQAKNLFWRVQSRADSFVPWGAVLDREGVVR